jgi:ketosteroid isomerase-like protein
MQTKRAVVRISSVAAIAAAAVIANTTAAKDTDDAAAITKLENDAVKAELANDKAFFEKYLAADFVGSSSFGERETRESLLKDMSDPKNNNVTKREISDLKVRVHGNAAIVTYSSTYDGVYRGEPRARSIIVTDVFVKEKGGWKLAAAHASEAKK